MAPHQGTLTLPQSCPLSGKLLGFLAVRQHTEGRCRIWTGPTYVVTQPGPPLPTGIEGVIEVPKSEPELDALLLNIPLQLLAYHVALAKGRDIDQPRNLAKSVTVE